MNLPSKGLLAASILPFTLALATNASAQQWADDFESYAVGSSLEGQGGWENQNGVMTNLTVVSDSQALSGTKSAKVMPGASTVYPLPTAQTTGTWDLSTQIYIETGSNASTLVRFLSTYQQSGQMEYGAWFLIDSVSGQALSFVGNPAPMFVPIPMDRWFEVRAHIDLDNDTADIYFDGALLNTMVWSNGNNGMTPGATAIAGFQTLGATSQGQTSTGSFMDDTEFTSGPVGIGTAYCSPAEINSTGAAGVLAASGSDVAADNQVVVHASDLPTNSFAFVIVSDSQGLVINPGGSAGNLCLAGDIGRYVGAGQIQNSGAMGTFDLTLDLTAVPQPTGPVGTMAGDTWNFQAWYRDSSATGPTSNFTNGLSVTFQ